jgi:hypothetical protein
MVAAKAFAEVEHDLDAAVGKDGVTTTGRVRGTS